MVAGMLQGPTHCLVVGHEAFNPPTSGGSQTIFVCLRAMRHHSMPATSNLASHADDLPKIMRVWVLIPCPNLTSSPLILCKHPIQCIMACTLGLMLIVSAWIPSQQCQAMPGCEQHLAQVSVNGCKDNYICQMAVRRRFCLCTFTCKRGRGEMSAPDLRLALDACKRLLVKAL